MKKLIALLLAVLMVVSLFAGCAQKAEDAPAAEPEKAPAQDAAPDAAPEASAPAEDAADAPAADPNARPFEGRTLTLAHYILDAAMEGLNAQFAAFEEKTGAKIEVELLAENGDESESILLTRAATGSLPDVFCASSGAKMKEFSPADNIMDLSGQAFVERLTDDYKSVVDGDNGEIFGVPIRPVNIGGVFYNKSVYAELGLEVPTTWEQLMENCQIIRDTTDKDPVVGAYDGAAGRQILFLSQYYYVARENPDFADQYTNREITLSESPAYMRGLEKMYELHEKGYLNEDPLSTSFDDSAIMLAEGSAVHTFSRTNIVGTINNVAPDKIDEIGFFPLPDENEDLALALLEFLVSDEGLEAYCTGAAPTGVFAIKGSTLPDDVPQVIKDAQDWVSKDTQLVMEYYCDIKGSNMSTILSMVGTGELNPDEAVAEIEADNAIDAQQKGIPGW